MLFSTQIGTDIQAAARLLQVGQLVAIPTETVYGLAGNALDEKAVTDIFSVKKRPSFDPLIIHLAQPALMERWAVAVPEPLRVLAAAFMPGPLTLLLDKKNSIPDLVTSGSPLVAIRVPSHPMAQALLALLDFPLAAPSANPFGYISPTTAGHVQRQLGGSIPYILDGGPCHVGLESTIVGLYEGQITVFRKGGLSVEAIENLIGPVAVREHSSSNPQAPGMLKSHYAPRKPLILGTLDQLQANHTSKRVGVLAFSSPLPGVPIEHQRVLSATADLHEAARQLFAAMRYLDEQELDVILAELVPETGLGLAINDRLRRAAAQPD